MNYKSLILSFIFIAFITTSCINKKEDELVPIRYDYEHLKLTLNSSLSDTINDIWRWDYMTSINSVPDTIGTDHYMNISQASFLYNGQETLPFLGITTVNNRITEFSATVIFNLENREKETIHKLLDSLTTFDILKDDNVRKAIIDKGVFYNTINTNFEEMIELEISPEEFVFDKITYSIKNKY